MFVPLVESGICLLVDLATLSTIYDVRHPLLPPGYPTQELISCPQAVRPPSSTPTLAACISDVQDLRESCDQLVPRLQEVAAVCDTLQEKNAEHETLWAAIAPKLVRLDALLDTHANAPLGDNRVFRGRLNP